MELNLGVRKRLDEIANGQILALMRFEIFFLKMVNFIFPDVNPKNFTIFAPLLDQHEDGVRGCLLWV